MLVGCFNWQWPNLRDIVRSFMTDYFEVVMAVADTDKSEMLVALLADLGFEGFEETDGALRAYIAATHFNETALQKLLEAHSLAATVKRIAPQNWNAVWESGFQPVVVADAVAVRANFHPAMPSVAYEIVVTPKMSFGTGHHATTYLMLQQMLGLDFMGKTVVDFGTGTGVLAILAEMRGAADVLAIDNDDWSIENAAENVVANGCRRIRVQKAESVPQGQRFDIILANINLNVIQANLTGLFAAGNPGGRLLLSGFLPQDEAILWPLLLQNGFVGVAAWYKDNWACMAAQVPLTTG
jgi:ribosomal protein L11 methyltransferase